MQCGRTAHATSKLFSNRCKQLPHSHLPGQRCTHQAVYDQEGDLGSSTQALGAGWVLGARSSESGGWVPGEHTALAGQTYRPVGLGVVGLHTPGDGAALYVS